MQVHNILPLYDEKSRVLILGSFPSVKSREAAFFYAHPQNRFWPTLAAVLGEETPKTVEEKKAMVLRRGVAMWDTIGSCEIVGSSDASITNVVPNDLSVGGHSGHLLQRRHVLRLLQKILPREARARGRPTAVHLAG